jgi:hypothetical protein
MNVGIILAIRHFIQRMNGYWGVYQHRGCLISRSCIMIGTRGERLSCRQLYNVTSMVDLVAKE